MFLHSRVPGLFPLSSDIASLASSFSELFLITCAFSRTVSWLTGVVATFLYQKVIIENATVDPWRSARRKNLPGMATTALYTGQEDSTTDKTVGETAVAPSYPRLLECLILQKGQSMRPQYHFLKGTHSG